MVSTPVINLATYKVNGGVRMMYLSVMVFWERHEVEPEIIMLLLL